MKQMTIVCICHYFHPEISAPSARLFEMAKAWVKSGHRVKVVTCFPNHPTGVIPDEYRGKRFSKEIVDGIEVYRNYVYATPNRGFLRKTLGHLSFMFSSVIFSLPRIREADIIVASSPTLLAVLSAFFFSRVRRIPYIFEVRDLWPAIFVDLGVLRNKTIISALERIEMFLYRHAAHVVTVTDAFRADITSRGIPDHKVAVITNGADVTFFSPGRDGAGVREEFDLGDRFVVLYIGAHGISHGLQSVLAAAEILKEHDDIHFLFVGEGAEKPKLLEWAASRTLKNVTFAQGQTRTRVPEFYAASDVCLVPLRAVELFKGFIPSKMFEILASGRPIIGSVEGEARTILESSGAVVIVEPEVSDQIADAILSLKENPSERDRMGERGRRFVVENYSRERLASEYEEILSDVVMHRKSERS